MNSRFTSLSFIIGLFFVLIALVLIIGYFISSVLAENINLYAGIIFFLFGLVMIGITSKDES